MSEALSGVASIDAVLNLARHIPVFPCKRNKKPLTEHGFKEATQDPDTIRSWWKINPDALVGVPTGSITGMVAIDYDIGKRSEPTDAWMTDHLDALLTARVHTTLRGGKHYLFRIPKGVAYRSGSDLTLGSIKRPGIDVRADGGYIIWWPLHGGATAGNGSAPLLPHGLIDERLISAPKNRTTEAVRVTAPAEWPETERKLLLALPFVDPAHRDTWRDVGMAISLETGGADYGFTLWHRWSAGELTGGVPDTYAGLEECQKQWASYRHTTANPVTLGSVFRLAKIGHAQANQRAPAVIPDLIPGTDMANARRFTDRHGMNLRFTTERGWMVWSGKKWQVDEKGVAVAKLAMESAESLLSELKNSAPSERDKAYAVAKLAAQKRAIEASVWMGRSHCPEHLANFDANLMLFNCRNGIIDLASGELLKHDRAHYCSLMGGCDYQVDAAAPRWMQFLSEITLGNQELIDYLQRMAGYLLTGDTNEQCLFFGHGDGSNGKTTFVETLMRCMGEYALSAEPDMLMSKRDAGIPNDVARLRGLRACFMNETKQGHHFDEAKLKNLTGGDTLTARFLREEFFDFRPTHKLVLRGNHKPTVNGTDEGIWRRLRLIPFDLRLQDGQKDRTLMPSLAKELPGVLAWMVQGCLLWQKSGLGTPAIVAEAVREYRAESDTLGRFIEDQCTMRNNAQVKSSVLHKAYREFCDAAGERYLSAKDFPGELEQRGFKRKKSNGERLTLGLELKTSLNDYHGDDADRDAF